MSSSSPRASGLSAGDCSYLALPRLASPPTAGLCKSAYTKFDVVSHWVAMVLPLPTMVVRTIDLGRTLLSRVLPYFPICLLGIVVVLVMAFSELQKAIRE